MTSIYDIDTVTLADEGVWMNLEHPTTAEELQLNDLPVRVKVLGADGPRATKIQQAAAEKVEKEKLRNRGRRNMEFETLVYKDMMARIVIDLDNVVGPDGPIEYSLAAVKELFDKAPWIFEQTLAFFMARSNFLKPSAKN